MMEDPALSRRLKNAQDWQGEYFARRLEAGDEEARRQKMAVEADVELESGPGGASESR